MIKRLTLILALCCSVTLYAQHQYYSHKYYLFADSLIKEKKYFEAYSVLKKIEPETERTDTIYPRILWDYTKMVSLLEEQARLAENWRFSVSYAIEALTVIKKGKYYFAGNYAEREYWMLRNVIIAFFGLGYPEKAKDYQDKLYKAYREGKLPEGLNEFYGIEYFKWEGKNVWGYEFYATPADSGSLDKTSKIVYYVNSTNPDGTDNQQLYRVYVARPAIKSDKYDYVLTKELEATTNETDGALTAYTYKAPVDYQKLKADIRKVIKGVYQPVKPATNPPKKNATPRGKKPAAAPVKKKS